MDLHFEMQKPLCKALGRREEVPLSLCSPSRGGHLQEVSLRGSVWVREGRPAQCGGLALRKYLSNEGMKK